MGNNSAKSRLEQQMDFILEVDKSKQVVRQTYLADGSRKENDAEHAWHLAIMAMLMGEHANEPVDVLKVIKMVLVHDLVEIDAGDTYAYDAAGNETKRERELLAAVRIFELLPEDQAKELRALWDEFEEGETAEARFALSLDKIQPLLLNNASGGISWKEHGVKLSQVLNRNASTGKGSQAMWEYSRELIEENVKKGLLIDDAGRPPLER